MFKQHGQYQDVERALNKALSFSAGTVDCGTRNMAINWRQRAYRFRQRWQDYTREIYAGIPEREAESGKSPWDDMILRLNGTKVEITFERRELTFIAPDGSVSSLGPEPEPEPIGPLGLEEIEPVAEGAFRSGPRLEIE